MTLLHLAPNELLLLQQSLLAWGHKNFRPFPWRETSNPYHVLLAEVFLHRTRARQAAQTYLQFIQQYPEINDMIARDPDEIRKALFGLGLHWRTELLIEMARQIQMHYDGQIPRSRDALLALPGVSAYIAGAMRCFAWHEPEVLLDTNTVRIIGRLLGWEIKDSSRRNPRFRQALEALLDHENPRAFNYALLDLAHLVCLKRQPPRCRECPLKNWCAFALTQPDDG